MNSSNLLDLVLKICQLLNIIIGIICFLVVSNKVYAIFFVLMVSTLILLIYNIVRLKHFICFVEFLFENDIHNFELLPKMRLYLHYKKIKNNIDILDLDISYNIFVKSKEQEKNLLGNLEIIYKINMSEEKIPKTFHMITGNDFSEKPPKLWIKYGNMNDFAAISYRDRNCAWYNKTSIRDFHFNISENKIVRKGNFILEIKILYDESPSFDFSSNNMETIICLPKIFSDSVKKITYYINLIGFDNKLNFNVFPYVIKSNKKDFEINSIATISNGDRDINKFIINLYPNEIKWEKAYYFKIGLNEHDSENRL